MRERVSKRETSEGGSEGVRERRVREGVRE